LWIKNNLGGVSAKANHLVTEKPDFIGVFRYYLRFCYVTIRLDKSNEPPDASTPKRLQHKPNFEDSIDV